MAVKVLLDTDIGSDIDDALCLAYLLENSECYLLGITTVTGQPQKRAMLASAICMAAGRDVPIVPGREDPLFVEQKQRSVPQAEALEKWSYEDKFPDEKASDFMASVISQHPGEVVVLAVGPLTNVAEMLVKHPEAASEMAGLVCMCGDFPEGRGPGQTEWNASGDPHATSIVAAHRLPFHRWVGLNVTLRTVLEQELLGSLESKVMGPVKDFAKIWLRTNQRIVLHDPLAAVTIFHPEVCPTKRGWVRVETSEKGATTMLLPHPNGRHEVATDLDAGLFYDCFTGVLLGRP